MNKWNTLLLSAALASGLMLITARNQTRDHFAQLDSARQEMAKMHEEYEILRIRRAELTNTARVQSLARQQGLAPPTLNNTRMIKENSHADSQ